MQTHPCPRRCIWSGSAVRPGDSCPCAFVLHRVSPPQTPPSPVSSHPASRRGPCARGPGWRWSDASDWCQWWSGRTKGQSSGKGKGTDRWGEHQVGEGGERKWALTDADWWRPSSAVRWSTLSTLTDCNVWHYCRAADLGIHVSLSLLNDDNGLGSNRWVVVNDTRTIQFSFHYEHFGSCVVPCGDLHPSDLKQLWVLFDPSHGIHKAWPRSTWNPKSISLLQAHLLPCLFHQNMEEWRRWIKRELSGREEKGAERDREQAWRKAVETMPHMHKAEEPSGLSKWQPYLIQTSKECQMFEAGFQSYVWTKTLTLPLLFFILSTHTFWKSWK